jgi:two-component system, chemotaxis family, protein-glutamate methylesterase/glutaminase
VTERKTRVLVADDSATARALLGHLLRQDADLEVAGEARDGLEAVELTARLSPDVVTMDVSMPRLDGFEATRRIMGERPLPIVIVSSLDTEQVAFAMEAIRAGALAVLPKPEGPASVTFSRSSRLFTDTVKAMAAVKMATPRPPKVAPLPVVSAFGVPGQAPSALAGEAALVHATYPRPCAPMEVVAMVASIGGPGAVYAILSRLPASFPAPILLVQQIALGFPEGFASWLAKSSRLRVKVGQRGEPLAGGTVYVAPDDHHLGVGARGVLALSEQPPIGGQRPSGTFLFDSVARVYGPGAVGVILTGLGDDGVDGLRGLHRAGGRVLAQDEESCTVFGMPGAAVSAGVVDEVLPLGEIAGRLEELAKVAGEG